MCGCEMDAILLFFSVLFNLSIFIFYATGVITFVLTCFNFPILLFSMSGCIFLWHNHN